MLPAKSRLGDIAAAAAGVAVCYFVALLVLVVVLAWVHQATVAP